MKKAIIFIIALGIIIASFGENTSHQIDSLRLILKTAPNDSIRVKSLNELSAYLVDMDNYKEALEVANTALSLSERLNYIPGIASSYRKIGVNYIQTGEYARALEFLLKSLRINDSLKNNEEIFKLNNNIGNMYYSQGNDSSALAYFMRAYSYKKNDAFTNGNIGITYMAQKNYKLSLVFLEKALALYSQKSDENEMANMIADIGTIYEYRGSLNEAFEYYYQALKIKEDIQDVQGQSDNLGSIGDILIKQKKYSEAIIYENRSLVLSRKIGYMTSVQETLNRLHEIYDALGQKDEAYYYYRNYISVRDSIYNGEELKKIVKSEMNFDFDKKEAIGKAVHIEAIKHQQILRNIFIYGFIIILIFSIFLFRSFKRERKQKEIIEIQKKIVDEQQKEVSDSISYAAKLQRAMLPSKQYINDNFKENLLIFLPRDMVSGDFYYNYRDEKSIYFASADATGHSVGGSLTASLANSLLNDIIVSRKITSPEIILNTLRTEIIKSLNQTSADEERKEGVDIALCRITDMKLECACANNSIYIIRDKSLMEIKSDRFPVGKYVTDLPFTLKTFDLQKGDLIFTFSDGYEDQFGGPKNKKLMSKKFKEWLIELSPLEMSHIKLELECRFNTWKGFSEPQTDDVTIFGVRV